MGKMLLHLKRSRTTFFFILPLLVFLAVMVVYPVGYIIRLSFYEWSLSIIKPMEPVGLENYLYILKDPDFWHSVVITLKFAFWAVLVELLLGIALAIFIGNRKFRGQNLIKTGFILPMVATPVAVALTWSLLYDANYGFINFILEKIGLYFPALSSTETALAAVIIVDIWQWTPLIMLMVIAGMTSLPQDPYEAAMLDGASKFQVLTRITLPQLKPTIITALLLRMIDALKSFDIIYATTQGGPGTSTKTLNILVYQEAFSNYRFGRASAYIVLFSVFILIVISIFMLIRRRLGEE